MEPHDSQPASSRLRRRRSPGPSERKRVLGVDIGRVISADDTDNGVSMLTENWRSTPFEPGALASLARLNTSSAFAGRIYLVSKCGPKIEGRTRTWLLEQKFFALTGIDRRHLYFVRERSEKARLCRYLGVTDFVDDRLGVLLNLDIPGTRYLYAPLLPPQIPPAIVRVSNWSELEDMLHRGSLR